MASSISLPSFSAKTSNILNPDGTSIDQSFAPTNGGMFRNRIINGDMRIWQRGVTASSGFVADRWYAVNSSSFAQSTDVPNADFKYSALITSSVGFPLMLQRIESANARDMASKSITVSFWAKCTGTSALSVALAYPTTTEDTFGTYPAGSTTEAGAVELTASPSSSWTYYTATIAVPAGASRGLQLSIFRGSSVIATTTYITGVQLEKGSSATPFEVRPIGTELALCQRYCYVLNKSQANNYVVGLGVGVSATAVTVYIPLPVEQRAVPTLFGVSVVSNWYIAANGTARIATSISQPANLSGINAVAVEVAAASASITTQNIYSVHQNAFTGTLMRFESEL